MSKKKPSVEERIAALKAQGDKIARERAQYELMAQEARKEAETLIPEIQGRIAAIDGKITELQQERSAHLETLKALGLKVKVTGKGKERAGGMKEKLRDMIRSVGIGAEISNADIKEFVGSSSGYVGMCVGWEVEAGNLQRVEGKAGVYKVTGMP